MRLQGRAEMGNIVTKTKTVDGSVYYYRADKNEPPDEPKISDRPLSDYERAMLMSTIQIGNGNSISSVSVNINMNTRG